MVSNFRREIDELKHGGLVRWVEIPAAEYKRAKELVPPEEFMTKFKKSGTTSVYGDERQYYRLEENNDHLAEDSELALWLSMKTNQRLDRIGKSVETIKTILIVVIVLFVLLLAFSCISGANV